MTLFMCTFVCSASPEQDTSVSYLMLFRLTDVRSWLQCYGEPECQSPEGKLCFSSLCPVDHFQSLAQGFSKGMTLVTGIISN